MDKDICKITYIIFPSRAKQTAGEFTVFEAVNKDGIKRRFNGNVSVITGKEYEIMYEVTEHPKYGLSYTVNCMYENIDLCSVEGTRMFLSTLTSEKITERIIDTFGNGILKILDNGDADTLKKIHGIGNITAARIISLYNEKRDEKEAYLVLGEYGFSSKQLLDITQKYGLRKAKSILENNIYDLTDVEGISFKTLDSIALKCGYKPNDQRRIIAGLSYCFDWALDNKGWSYMSRNQLWNIINKLNLPDFSQYVDTGIQYMIKNGIIVLCGKKQNLSLKKLYDIEFDIKKQFERLNGGHFQNISRKTVEKKLRALEKKGFVFSFEQTQFLKTKINCPVNVLTGSAGTGKTFTVRGFVDILGLPCYGVALSGRAASNLKDSLGDVPCSTIHKALQFGNGNKPDEDFVKAEIIIVDESTMIDGNLFLKLLQNIDTGKRVVIMGDIKQLPPIGKCQIYHDILESGIYPSTTLTKLFRQEAGSGIIPLSFAVSNGDKNAVIDTLKTCNDVNLYHYTTDEIINGFRQQFKENGFQLRDVQLCFATKAECADINRKIHDYLVETKFVDTNKKITFVQDNSETPVEFCVGDKVINTQNIYHNLYNTNGKNATCMNGEIGIVRDVCGSALIIEFIQNKVPVNIIFESCKGLLYGYACTCHKLQGSGFNSVLIGLSRHVHMNMYSREWLYTAITRAKKTVNIYTDTEPFNRAIACCETNSKQTLLKSMITNDEELIGVAI